MSVEQLKVAIDRGSLTEVQQLLDRGVDVNAVLDNLGYTPLHCAVRENQTEVVDMLVFLGVDINHMDWLGKTVFDRSLDQPMLDILNQQTVTNRPVDIFSLKHLEVKSIGGIKVKCGSRGDFDDLSTFLLLKHYRLGENKSIPQLQDDELAWSDVFELRKDSNVKLTVTFPLQDQPDRFSELLVKYGTRGEPKNAKIRYKRDKACCEAVAEISIGRSGWFYLCCRPKRDRLDVPAIGGRISSTLDLHLTLDVPRETFKTPGDITIKTDTLDKVYLAAWRKLEEGIRAVSNFYQMKHSSGQQPLNGITMTIPLSDDYSGTEDISVLSHTGSKSTEDENNWEVEDTPVKVKDRCASFSSKTLTIKVLLESNGNSSTDKKKKHAANLYKGKKAVSVDFIACGKKRPENSHDVVIECCKSKSRDSRIEYWHYRQYKLLKQSGMFLWEPGTRYGMQTVGNLTSLEDISRLPLVYHPGMICSQSMTLSRTEEGKDESGSIAITDQERTTENGDNYVITYLPLCLHDDMNKRGNSKDHGQPSSVKPDMAGASGGYLHRSTAIGRTGDFSQTNIQYIEKFITEGSHKKKDTKAQGTTSSSMGDGSSQNTKEQKARGTTSTSMGDVSSQNSKKQKAQGTTSTSMGDGSSQNTKEQKAQGTTSTRIGDGSSQNPKNLNSGAVVRPSESTDTETKDVQHPPGDPYKVNNSNGCSCGQCQPLPTEPDLEFRCCSEITQVKAKLDSLKHVKTTCITQHPGFTLCLSPYVLESAEYQNSQEYGKEAVNRDQTHEEYRYLGYRQLVRWCWGKVGRTIQVPLPACAVIKIRERFQ